MDLVLFVLLLSKAEKSVFYKLKNTMVNVSLSTMSYRRHKMVVLIRIRDKIPKHFLMSCVPLMFITFFGNLMYRCSKYAEGRKTLAVLVILWEKVHNFINFYGHTDSNKAFSFFCNHWLHDIFTHQC